MSTILKALRRLESEAPALGRPLREAVTAGGVATRRTARRWPVAVAALLLGGLLGAGVLWLWPEGTLDVAAGPSGPGVATQVGAEAPGGVGLGSSGTAGRVAPGPLEPRSARAVPRTARGAGGPPPEAFSSQVAVVERPEAAPRLAEATPGLDSRRAPLDPSEPLAFGPRAAEPAAAGPVLAQAPPRKTPAPSTDPWLPPGSIAEAVAPPPELAVEEPAARRPKPMAEAVAASPGPAHGGNPAPREQQPVQPMPRAPARSSAVEGVLPRNSPDPPPTPLEATRVAPVEQAAPSPAAVPQMPSRDLPPPIAPGAIRVERTLWHPVAERREAVLLLPDPLGTRRVREGERVGDLEVTRIEPAGVVFAADGALVLRAVGASPN